MNKIYKKRSYKLDRKEKRRVRIRNKHAQALHTDPRYRQRAFRNKKKEYIPDDEEFFEDDPELFFDSFLDSNRDDGDDSR